MESDVVLITQDEIDNEQIAPTEQRSAGDVMDATKKGRRRHPDMPLYTPIRKSAAVPPVAAASLPAETASGGAGAGGRASASRAPLLCDEGALPAVAVAGSSSRYSGTSECDCGGAGQKLKPRSASKRDQVMEGRGSGCTDQHQRQEQHGRQGRPVAAVDDDRTIADRRSELQRERGNGDCTEEGDSNYRPAHTTERGATDARRNMGSSCANQRRSRGENSRGDSRGFALSSAKHLPDRSVPATIGTQPSAAAAPSIDRRDQQSLAAEFASSCRVDCEDSMPEFNKMPTLVFSRSTTKSKGASAGTSVVGVDAAVDTGASGSDASAMCQLPRNEKVVEAARDSRLFDLPASGIGDYASKGGKGPRKPQLSKERNRQGRDTGIDTIVNSSAKVDERQADPTARLQQQQRLPATRPSQSHERQSHQQQLEHVPAAAASGRPPEGSGPADKEPLAATYAVSKAKSVMSRGLQRERTDERPKETVQSSAQSEESGDVRGGSGKRRRPAARREGNAHASVASSAAAAAAAAPGDSRKDSAFAATATAPSGAAATAAASPDLPSSSLPADRLGEEQPDGMQRQRQRGGLIKLPTAAVSPQPQLAEAAPLASSSNTASRLMGRSRSRPTPGVSSSGSFHPADDLGWYGYGPPLPPMWPSREAAGAMLGGSIPVYPGYADQYADTSSFGASPYYHYYAQQYADAAAPSSQAGSVQWSSPALASVSNSAAQVQLLMLELMPPYQQLTELAGRRLHGGAILDHLNQLRPSVRDTCEKIILTDVEFAYTNGVDQMLWRAAYHLVIESLRKQTARSASGSNDDDDDETNEVYEQGSRGSSAAAAAAARHTGAAAAAARRQATATTKCGQLLGAILDEGGRFYGHLITAIERAYGVNAESPGDAECGASSADASIDNGSGSSSSAPGSSRVHGRRTQKFALLTCQRLFVCLGDIARYKEFVSHTSNFGKSRSWYLKALRIAPKNGSPYHQLALLALYTGRKLEAVYYYMRCLAASNPFLNARENLAVLFDEIRKKMEARLQKEASEKRDREQKRAARRQQLDDRLLFPPPERGAGSGFAATTASAAAYRRSPSQPQQQLGLSSGLHEPWSHRIEIWISPDGGRSSVRDSDDDESENVSLSKMSAPELIKEFTLSFLNTHGKLYTKIGMESFPEASSRLLHLLLALLRHSTVDVSLPEGRSLPKPGTPTSSPANIEEQGPTASVAVSPASGSGATALSTAFARLQFIELITINMFSIHHTALRGDGMDVESCRSFLQEQAIQLAMDMFAILVQHCTALITAETASRAASTNRADPERLFSHPDLRQLLWVVKTWSDWMTCHPHLWNPPPCPRDPALGPVLDVWESLARFFNVLLKTDVSFLKVSVNKHEGWDELRLPGHEHLFLGFLPLGDLPPQVAYAHPSADKGMAEEAWLVMKLRVFADYVCGLEPPMLDYSVAQRQYVSLMLPPSASEKKGVGTSPFADRDESEEASISNSSADMQPSEPGVSTSVDDNHVRDLLAKQRELRQAIVEQQVRQETRKAVFDKECRSIRVEITPAFLIPDTNCFIDNLHLVRRLVESRKYSVVVPLVVINELDGLSRSRVARRQKTHRMNDDFDDDSGRTSVGSSAAAAIAYLEEAFESGSFKNLTALTARGNTLNTIQYRSEERDQMGNNDDKILECCVHYCKDRASSFMPKERNAPITLQREVVLLTDDRNLRLKAHTYNVPVKDIVSFVKWCKIG